MAYVLAALLLLGVGMVVALMRGRRRRAREMQALRSIMRQALDDEPEKPESKDR